MPESDPATSPAPEPPAKRPWTILGRLTKAIREQNWFAVVLEVMIVVLGVVIGFQVTAWGQARSDRAKEQEYLRQLVADLHETERHIEEVNAWVLPRETGAGELLRSFYQPSRPNPDTLLSYIIMSMGHWVVAPVVGTTEALVATGDLALIQSDSLRSAVTAYLRLISYEKELSSTTLERLVSSQETLSSGRDLSGDLATFLNRLDLLSREDPLYPLPLGARRPADRLDVEAFLANTTMEHAAYWGLIARFDHRRSRKRLHDATVALREQVEAEIEP